MSVFSQVFLKAASGYKELLGKYLPAWQKAARINSMKLRSKDLKQAKEIQLYQKLKPMLEDISNLIKIQDLASHYSGLEQFHGFLKQILSEYTVLGEEVVHIRHSSSRALIESIQLMSLDSINFSESSVQKLLHCKQTIARLGSEEEKESWQNAVHMYAYRDAKFFSQLLL